jgi:epoxyqueuosine reductase
VCPYNHKFAKELSERAFAPRTAIAAKDAASLATELLAMSQPEFSAAFKGSSMKRAKLRGLKRNAAVVLGNIGDAAAVPALGAALSDAEPLVRTHAAWALGKIRSPEALGALRARESEESDSMVLGEIGAASLGAAR